MGSRTHRTSASPLHRQAIAYVATAAAFVALDAIWLTTMADVLYRPMLGHLFRDGFDPLAALGFYLLYVGGVVGFVVLRRSGGSRVAVARGAFFGLVAYATYDLTNQATVRDWPWIVTVADLCWGTFATAAAAGIGHALTRRLAGSAH